MSQSIHFACTMCGKCCHNLRLPLSVDEAIDWAHSGGRVEFFCEAIPWPEEPLGDDLPARHKRQRSFAAISGELPIRVVVNLVASFDGACPFLQADMRCGAYAYRPRVCRIYPAEVNPFVPLDPAGKVCPPEAWCQANDVLTRNGIIVDTYIATVAAQSREADARDVDAKARACFELGISTVALANEGVTIYSPDRERVFSILSAARGSTDKVGLNEWLFVSNRSSTREILEEIGATVASEDGGARAEFRYFPSGAEP